MEPDSQTDWQFFLKADDAWTSMKEAVRDAKKEILCEQYIINNDSVGKEFLDILIEKARAGVGVQIIADMVGSVGFFSDAELLSRVRSAGINVIFWNPVKLWRLDTIFSWFFRDHRKLLIVDSTVGFVGGVGFRADMREWRDTHLKVIGPVVEEMQHAFLEMWALAHEHRFLRRIRHRKHFSRGFQFITNSPSIHRRFIYDTIAHEIAHAKERILITTPYFIPDRKMLRLLRLASLRGVRVEILLPKHSNHPWVDRAGKASFEKLLSSAVEIYTYEDAMLHAKTFVIDNHFASVGSFNFDSLSFRFNYEGNVISHHPLFVDQVAAYFAHDRANAPRLRLSSWRARSTQARIEERLATFIRQLL